MFKLVVALLSAQVVTYTLDAPASARAQAPAPLKMTLINVSTSGGERAHEQLRSILEENPNVQVFDDAEIKARLEDYALDLKILRKGDLRKKYKARIRRMLKAQGLEGLFLVDIYSRGSKLQLVVIGPEGAEIVDLERGVRNGQATNKQSIEILQKAFGALGPEVLAYRDANPDPSSEEPEEADPLEPDPSEEELRKELEAAKRRAQGNLSRKLDLGVGVFIGRRNMEVKEGDTAEDFRLEHGSPFVGVGVRGDAIATTFSEGHAALGVGVFGNYAQFTTIFYDMDTNGKQELSSSFSRFGAELSYIRSLSPRFLIDGYAGAELISLTIATNAFYTGNRYVMGRAGVGVGLRLGQDATLRPHVGILPVFSADNSGGAFGSSPLSFGYEAGARLNFSLTESFFVQANYTFQYLAPDFPEPSAVIGAPTSSTDLVHTGNLLFGLSL